MTKKRFNYWLLVIPIIVIAIGLVLFSYQPIYAYQESDEVIGRAFTLEEAQSKCNEFYFVDMPPFPSGAFAQAREIGGFECLPIT